VTDILLTVYENLRFSYFPYKETHVASHGE
jgi:hypothetical protein